MPGPALWPGQGSTASGAGRGAHVGCGDGTFFAFTGHRNSHLHNPLGPWRAIHPAPEHHPCPERCTPTHFEQKASAFLFLAVFKWQLHFPVGSHSAAAFFHSQPVTPSFPPTLLLNNSDAERLHFKMLLAYLYPSCITILCIVYFSAFRSFLIHRKQEQDGKVCMKYLFLPGRKHRLLTQAMLQTVQTL